MFSDRSQCVTLCWPSDELMPRGDDPAPLRCDQINSTARRDGRGARGFLTTRGGDSCTTARLVSPDSYAVEVRPLWFQRA